jgi:hypothetical protein
MGRVDRLPGVRVSAGLRARYGASPAHLLAHLVALPLVAYALLAIVDRPDATRILVWLAASAIVHDFVLLPFYSVLDRLGRRAGGPAVNHVRVPGLLSGLLLLVFFPAISGEGNGAFHGVSGLDYEGYLRRWLLVSAALFAVSGALYLARRAGFPRRSARPTRSA